MRVASTAADHARFMFKQLIAGLEHLHDNHVAHR